MGTNATPGIVYWLTATDIVLTTLPHYAGDAFTKDSTKKAVTRPWIPLAAVAWSLSMRDVEWRGMDELPAGCWGLRRLSEAGRRVVVDDEEEG